MLIPGFISNILEWSQLQVKNCFLPDKRLVPVMENFLIAHAANPRGSTAEVSNGNDALKKILYRLLENERVDPKGIDQGTVQRTADICKSLPVILAIQDTTSVQFGSHQLKDFFKEEKGTPHGFIAHTVLAVDPESEGIIGLLNQDRWIRHPNRERDIQITSKFNDDEKESIKWINGLKACHELMDGSSTRVITVADREADIFSFIEYCIETKSDFILRSNHNRKGKQSEGDTQLTHLHDAVMSSPVLLQRKIDIEQRGVQRNKNNQKARDSRSRKSVLTEIRSCSFNVDSPSKNKPQIKLNAVLVSEVDPDDDLLKEKNRLEWFLITSEPIDTEKNLDSIVRNYELRWKIEEFFKCWKTGCRLETRPLQSIGNFERMMSLTIPIAILMMQLHACAANKNHSQSAEEILGKDHVACLLALSNSQKNPPEKLSAYWAYETIGRIAGWTDSKKTGRIGWQTLWKGWIILDREVASLKRHRKLLSS